MKTYKFLYWFFLVVGLLGFIDLLTQVVAKQEIGYISIGFISLFGAKIATVPVILFAFWPLWLIFAYSSRRMMKKIDNVNK